MREDAGGVAVEEGVAGLAGFDVAVFVVVEPAGEGWVDVDLVV